MNQSGSRGTGARAWLAGALAALALAAATPTASAGSESESEPAAMVRDTIDSVLVALRERRDEIAREPGRARAVVREIAGPRIDFERIARLMLGKYWSRIDEGRRARFRHELSELLVRTYATALAENLDARIEYLGASVDSERERATVSTRVPRPGAGAASVRYRLANVAGEWKVYDIIIEGASLVMTHRAAFAAAIGHEGVDGLLDRLAASNRGA